MLLDTKIENRSYSFPAEEFDLSELVTKITDRLQIHSCGCEQVITPFIEPKIIITGDPFALSSVVNNLVENAVKYSGECAEITVELKMQDGHAFLSVGDKGPGIPDDEKMLIFDKFYRVGQEHTRKAKGTGLGLFIVKEVLQRHDADISVKDNVPQGTIFEITFS